MNKTATVSLVKCSSYSEGLRESIERMLGHLGGIGSFVKPGQKVLIKPNLLTDRTPSEAVTTHPEVVRAIIHILKDHGAIPCVGDSPISAVKLERVWERTGFRTMCEDEKVPLVNFEKAGSKSFSNKHFSFSIAKPVLEADVVINVPKVKTHVLTILTAAVKNLYGIVPGYQKSQLHKEFPDPVSFGELLACIYEQLPPALNIADAIVGMEGNGPSAGKPVDLGFMAASSNAAALDLTLCRLLRIKPKAVPYLRVHTHGDKSGQIRIVGADPDDLTAASFKVPSTFRAMLIPRWLVSIIAPFLWIRPSIGNKCISCGRCVKACPLDALQMEDKGKPVLDAGKCIGCCCCHEICPEKAVTMTQSPLLNFLRRGKIE